MDKVQKPSDSENHGYYLKTVFFGSEYSRAIRKNSHINSLNESLYANVIASSQPADHVELFMTATYLSTLYISE
jgi:hypothetical protein